MKTIKQGVIAAALFLTATVPTFAIEGLKIKVVCPDVVLSWPSTNEETYIVQYRATLDTNDAWATLTNSLPAVTGTNLTTFVHSNMVDCPPGQIFGLMSGGGSGESSSLDSAGDKDDSKWAVPMIVPKDESSPPAPLAIFPPGLDLSGWIIIWPDGSTEEWTEEFAEKYFAAQAEGQGGPQLDSGGGANNTGFYRVVRYGPSLYGISNGMTLTGTIEVPVELGGTNTELVGFTLYVDGEPAAMSQIETNSLGQWVATWDTTSIANGSHVLSLRASYLVLDYATDGPLEGVARTVMIDNGIIFPQPNTVFFGDLVWFYFQTKWAAVDYQIDVFINTNTYIGRFTNYITSGVESFYWYPVGDGFTNDEFRCEFYVQEHSGAAPSGNGPMGGAAGGSAQNTNHWYAREQPFTDSGYMVVAWGSPTGNSQVDNKAEIMVRDGVLNRAPYNFSPPNNPNSLAAQLTAGYKSSILGFFADPAYRYCYIFAHGDQNSFGPHADPAATIKKNEIIVATQNLPYAIPPKGNHPFKFVWIDGCESAKGDLSTAFGIPVGQYNNAYFNGPPGVNRHSRAFLGAYENYTYGYNTMDTKRAIMLGNFWQDWSINKPLWQCCTNAAANVNDPLKFWRIHGATNLTVNTF